MSAHDAFAETLPAYAAGALDARERAAFEAHLSTCEICRAELAELSRVTAALALSVEPEAPPPALRSATLLKATSQPQARSNGARLATARRSSPLAWLLAAAALVAAVAASFLAHSLRLELQTVRDLASAAVSRAEALRAELLELRRDQVMLVRIREVMSAGDAHWVTLRGTGAATGAVGTALWSPTRGLVFSGTGLPPLDAARVYQLWVVPPSGAPQSAGLLNVNADGRAAHVTALPNVSTAALVAITIEPQGGSASPTMPIVMSGQVN
ncbi:MAG TPA: anti-sigma factor [Vicinamibacterales bacterium]|nr:anti-sigma factor [Vicinamibacterales bacterium]